MVPSLLELVVSGISALTEEFRAPRKHLMGRPNIVVLGSWREVRKGQACIIHDSIGPFLM